MGCWLMFRGSLKIEPSISDNDRRAFTVFYPKGDEHYDYYDNYSNPWIINDEGRLECVGCKFGEQCCTAIDMKYESDIMQL